MWSDERERLRGLLLGLAASKTISNQGQKDRMNRYMEAIDFLSGKMSIFTVREIEAALLKSTIPKDDKENFLDNLGIPNKDGVIFSETI